jgi:hypothetical protein
VSVSAWGGYDVGVSGYYYARVQAFNGVGWSDARVAAIACRPSVQVIFLAVSALYPLQLSSVLRLLFVLIFFFSSTKGC